MAALAAPVPARGPWLTAVLNEAAAPLARVRPVAVVVEAHRQGRPGRRRRSCTSAAAGRRPSSRCWAAPARCPGRPPRGSWPGTRGGPSSSPPGVVDLLGSLRRPRQLRLAGLPLGDPTRARSPPGSRTASSPRRAPSASSTTWTASGPCRAAATPACSSAGSRRCSREPDRGPGVPAGRRPAARRDRSARAGGGGRRRPRRGPGCSPWSTAGPVALVGCRGRGLRTELGCAAGGPDRAGRRMAAGDRRLSSERRTLTSGSSTVGARPCPARARPRRAPALARTRRRPRPRRDPHVVDAAGRLRRAAVGAQVGGEPAGDDAQAVAVPGDGELGDGSSAYSVTDARAARRDRVRGAPRRSGS